MTTKDERVRVLNPDKYATLQRFKNSKEYKVVGQTAKTLTLWVEVSGKGLGLVSVLRADTEPVES